MDNGVDAMLADAHVAAFVKAPPPSQTVIGEAVALVGDQSCTRHLFESSLLCVESFSRAYAGKDSDATKLRHPNALDKAMHFLVQQYLRSPRDLRMLINHGDVWEYLWDRMRQIRTDWTKQLAVSADDPLCLRRIKWLQFTVAGMFVGAAVRSRNVPSCVRFMAHKWNYMESVSQTFSDLIVFYRMEGRYRSSEFVSIMALFTGLSLLHKCETHAQFCRWNPQTASFEEAHDAINLSDVYKELEYHPHMAATRHVRNALRVLHCLHQGGWFEFFELCRVLPWTPLQRCVLLCCFSYVRLRAVTTLLCSRPGKIGMARFRGVMPVEELTNRLLFDSTADCKQFLAVIRVDHCLDAEQLNLRLCDAAFAPMIAEPQLIHEHLLNVKQHLSFPPARDFIGFSPYQPLLDLAESGELTFEVSDDVSSHVCPINCMDFLEPYCPSYTPELEALALADAPETPWFSDIKGCRREFLGIDRDDEDADDGDSVATASDILDDDPTTNAEADDDDGDAADLPTEGAPVESDGTTAEDACRDDAVLALVRNAEAAVQHLKGHADYASAREERRRRAAEVAADRAAQARVALAAAEAQGRSDHAAAEDDARMALAGLQEDAVAAQHHRHTLSGADVAGADAMATNSSSGQPLQPHRPVSDGATTLLPPLVADTTTSVESTKKRSRREDTSAVPFNPPLNPTVGRTEVRRPHLQLQPPPPPPLPATAVLPPRRGVTVEEVQSGAEAYNTVVAGAGHRVAPPVVESPLGTPAKVPAAALHEPQSSILRLGPTPISHAPQRPLTSVEEVSDVERAAIPHATSFNAAATNVVRGRSYRDAVAHAVQRSQNALAAAAAVFDVPPATSATARRRRNLRRSATTLVAPVPLVDRCRPIIGWHALFQGQLLHVVHAAVTAPAVASVVACGGGGDAVLATILSIVSNEAAAVGSNVTSAQTGVAGTTPQLQASSIVVVCGDGLKEHATAPGSSDGRGIQPSTAMKVSALLRAHNEDTTTQPLRSGSMLLAASAPHVVAVGSRRHQHGASMTGFAEFRQSCPYNGSDAFQVRRSAVRPANNIIDGTTRSHPHPALTAPRATMTLTVDTNVACYCIDTADLVNLHFHTKARSALSDGAVSGADDSGSADDGADAGVSRPAAATISVIMCLDLLSEADWATVTAQLTLLARKGSGNGFRLGGVVFVLDTPSADSSALENTVALIEDIFWDAWEAETSAEQQPHVSQRNTATPHRPSSSTPLMDASAAELDRPRASMRYSSTRNWASATSIYQEDDDDEGDAWQAHKQRVWAQLEGLATTKDKGTKLQPTTPKPTLVYLPIQEVLSTATKHRQDPDECVRRALVSSLEALTSSYRSRSTDEIRRRAEASSGVQGYTRPVDVDVVRYEERRQHRRESCRATSHRLPSVGPKGANASLAAAMLVPFE